MNEEDDAKKLCVSHVPSMLPDECRRIGLTIQSEHLSIEKLLMQTIEVRTRAKLKVQLNYLLYDFQISDVLIGWDPITCPLIESDIDLKKRYSSKVKHVLVAAAI